MPYSQPHMLLQWGGALGGFDEEFAGVMRFAAQDGAWSEADVDKLDNIAVGREMVRALRQYWGNTDARIRNSAKLEWVKFNKIGRDGRYESTTDTRLMRLDEAVPGTGADTYPYQVALCTTYRTDAMRGRASRGRTFWPTSAPYDQNARGLSPAVQGQILTATVGLVNALNDVCRQAGSASRLVVASKVGEGSTRIVQRVEVGHAFDIQRRRDKSLLERYEVADVTFA